ncbi:hypothetical protein TMRO357_02358 [Alteriqipengyuania sp. 357]
MLKTNPCEDCKPAAPLESIAQNDIDAAAAIYDTYFRCYWSTLSKHPDFGSAEAQAAQAALVTARTSCSTPRESADRALDRFLLDRKTYGDATGVEGVRENFRRTAGLTFMYMTASANGVQDAYLTMMDAATETDAR